LVALPPLRFGQDLAQERLLEAPSPEALAREDGAHDGPPAVEHVVAVRDAARPILQDEPAQRAALEPAGHGRGYVGVVPEELAPPVLRLLGQERAEVAGRQLSERACSHRAFVSSLRPGI